MLDVFLSGAYAPFTLALALLFGLLALEIVFALLGATLLGAGGDGEVDLPGAGDGPDLDLELDLDADLGVDFDGLDIDPAEFELPGLDAFDVDVDAEAPIAAAPSGLLHWLGLGGVPALIWLAALLMSFGLSGVILQSVAGSLFAPLPALIAVIPAGMAGIWFTRRFARVFARLLPKTETQAVSQRSLARRGGTITQGTARRGTPAEVRVTDRYGNTHYVRAEPLQDGEELPQGARVLVLRHRPTGGFRLLPLE